MKYKVSIYNRYQVDCSHCGLLSTFMTWLEALDFAYKQTQIHENSKCVIAIFDLMAKKGSKHLWVLDDCNNFKEIKRKSL